MTREEAMDRLRKLGPQYRYNVGRSVTSSDRRAEARARLEELLEQRRNIDKQIQAARDAANAFKFQIYKRDASRGLSIDMEVGKGDTWEEAFAEVDQKGGH